MVLRRLLSHVVEALFYPVRKVHAIQQKRSHLKKKKLWGQQTDVNLSNLKYDSFSNIKSKQSNKKKHWPDSPKNKKNK